MKTFKVSDYKGIKGTVEVSTDGGSVIVQGSNAAGKSSFIDAITELFDARGVRLTPRPINDNADEAVAEFTDTELDVRVVREWKKNKDGGISSTLSVYALDGAKHKQPAQVIAELTGGMIFDPSRFLLLDPKPQRDALLRKVELPFNLEALEAEERTAEESRLSAGQVARAAEGAVTNAERPAPGTPSKPVSTAELVAELDNVRAHNARIQQAMREVQQHSAAQDDITDRIKSLEAQIKQLEKEYADASMARSKASEIAGEPLKDASELEAKVANVDEINRNVQIAKIRAGLEMEAVVKREAWEESEQAVKDIVQRKKDGLKQAVFPDPLLSVDDSGVLYDGVPFNQVNTAARNKAAFAIATAGDAALKLVIVKEGDLLDEFSLADIDRVAVERGFTVLVERGRPDVGGLVATFVEMKDGQVVA